MVKRADVPEFGPLSGVTVVHSGVGIASPFAATLFADFGADLIWIENPAMPDSFRFNPGYIMDIDRRNRRALALDFNKGEGRQVFLDLMKRADIFIESSKGGTFAKFGLTDEVLWEANPALVIVHLSGFGQDGVKEFVERPSWDGIGQAFGGLMFLNGNPEPDPPMKTAPFSCDYFSGLNVCWAALAALIKARETGRGDSVDVAQYEVMVRIQTDYPLKYLNDGVQVMRQGNEDPNLFGYDVYKCKDGNYIIMAPMGYSALKGLLPMLGFEWPSEDFPAHLSHIPQNSEGARKLKPRIKEFFSSRTVGEAEKELLAAGVPCSPVMNYEMMVKHPHYQAREVFTEMERPDGTKVKTLNTIPKFKVNPGQIWRGCPDIGTDNEDILEELGYSQDQIARLYENKIIGRKK